METLIPPPPPPADHIVENNKLESSTNPSGRVSRRPSVGSSSTPSALSLSKDNTQAETLAAPTTLPYHSEEALRKQLQLRDRDELAAWLSQDWVADVYIEYYDVAIHQWRTAMEAIEAAGGDIPLREKRLLKKFLVRRAADALRSRSQRYVPISVAKAYWTKDDHDIRFIVQIVDKGRASERCWERYTRGNDTEYLCAVVFRLMFWLRAMHKISVATSGMSRWNNANCKRWFNVLRHIRECRAGPIEKAATQRTPLPPSTSLTGEAPAAEKQKYHDSAPEEILSPRFHTPQDVPLNVDLLSTFSPAAALEHPGVRADPRVAPTSSASSTKELAHEDSPNMTSPKSSHDSLNEVKSRVD